MYILQGEEYFRDMEADQEECEEATGNAGAQMDRYEQASVTQAQTLMKYCVPHACACYVNITSTC